MLSITLNLQLEDILASYPSQEEPGLQSIVSRKLEFSELRAEGREPRPKPGEYMRHQQFVSRFMRAFDHLLLFHATGSGKTCSIVASAEWFKSQHKLGGHIKKVLYLVPGPTLKDEVARQIACSCTRRGEYTSTSATSSRSKTNKGAAAVGAKIRKWYKIIAYRSFVQKYILGKITIHRLPRDTSNKEEMDRWRRLVEASRREIYDQFSDTLIVLDEPQTINVLDSRVDLPEEKRFLLRQERKSGRMQRAMKAASSQVYEYEDTNLLEQKADDARKSKVGRDTGKSLYIDHEDVYDELWLLLHNVARSKVIVATATPMTGDVEEIRTLMNLILPLNKQMPYELDLRGFASNPNGQAGLDALKPYFEGRISYVRSLETGVKPVYMVNLGTKRKYLLDQCPGSVNTLPPETKEEQDDRARSNAALVEINRELEGKPYPSSSNPEFIPLTVIYRSPMSEYQNTAYKEARRKGEEGDIPSESRAQGLQINARYASNFVFPPDGNGRALWGRAGFRYWVDNRTDGFSGRIAESLDSNGDITIQNFKNHLEDIESMRQYGCKYASIVEICASSKGSDFIYGEFKVGSGLIVLALCFEAIGFKQFTEVDSVFIASTSAPGSASGSTQREYCGGSKETRTIDPRFKKMCRYALLTPETSKYHDSMRELFNSYENRYGDYIKVIMVSPTAQIGLSFNNILRGHLVSSEWTESANYQALSRFIRATSHEDLIREAEGRGIINPVIEVEIYQHCAVPWSIDSKGRITFERGIDEEMYYASESKDRKIKKVERWMKQSAVDCLVNKPKNQRIADKGKDGTQQCDYQSCLYTCVDEPIPDLKDVSTYDVYYTDQVVDRVIERYRDISHSLTYFTIEAIYALFPDVRRKFIDIALERMVYNKMDFLDNFGYSCYLVEDKGNFTLTRSYPVGNQVGNYYSSYYANNLIALTETELSAVAFNLQQETQQVLSQALQQGIATGEQGVGEKLGELNIEYQVNLLEDAVLKLLELKSKAKAPVLVGAMRVIPTRAVPPEIQSVLDLYESHYFTFYEPLKEMEKDRLKAEKPKKGRPPGGKSSVVAIDTDTVDLDTRGEMVYVHFLYGGAISEKGYGFMARYNKAEGRIRILKPSEKKGWRDCLPTECAAYNRVLQKQIAMRQASLSHKYYGIYNPQRKKDKQFSIVDRTIEDPGASRDKRKASTGLNCQSAKVPKLMIILYDIGYRAKIPPAKGQSIAYIKYKNNGGEEDPKIEQEKAQDTEIEEWILHYVEENKKKPLKELIDYISRQSDAPGEEEMAEWSNEKVQYVSALIKANSVRGFTKPLICPLMQAVFASSKQLLRIFAPKPTEK